MYCLGAVRYTSNEVIFMKIVEGEEKRQCKNWEEYGTEKTKVHEDRRGLRQGGERRESEGAGSEGAGLPTLQQAQQLRPIGP